VSSEAEYGSDVKPYIHPIEVEWKRVNLPRRPTFSNFCLLFLFFVMEMGFSSGIKEFIKKTPNFQELVYEPT